jgi:hypothetical protein
MKPRMMVRAYSMHGGVKNVYKTLVRKPEWTRPRHRWEGNIISIKDMECRM